MMDSDVNLIKHATYHAVCGERFRKHCETQPEFKEWWSGEKSQLLPLVSCLRITQSDSVSDSDSESAKKTIQPVNDKSRDVADLWNRYVESRTMTASTEPNPFACAGVTSMPHCDYHPGRPDLEQVAVEDFVDSVHVFEPDVGDITDNSPKPSVAGLVVNSIADTNSIMISRTANSYESFRYSSTRIWSDIEIYGQYKNDIDCMRNLADAQNMKEWEARLKKIDSCLTESQQGHETFRSSLHTAHRRPRPHAPSSNCSPIDAAIPILPPNNLENTTVYIPDAKANGNCFFYSMHAVLRSHTQTITVQNPSSALIYVHTFTGKRFTPQAVEAVCSNPHNAPLSPQPALTRVSHTSTSQDVQSQVQPHPHESDASDGTGSSEFEDMVNVGKVIEIPITCILSAIMAAWLQLSQVNEKNESTAFSKLAPLFLRSDYLYFSNSSSESGSAISLKDLMLRDGVMPVLHARMQDIYTRVQTPRNGLLTHAGVFEASQLVHLFEPGSLRIVIVHGEGMSTFEDSLIRAGKASRIIVDSEMIDLVNSIVPPTDCFTNLVTLKGSALQSYFFQSRYSPSYSKAMSEWSNYSEEIKPVKCAVFECYLQLRSTLHRPFIVNKSYLALDESLFSSFNHFDPILFSISTTSGVSSAQRISKSPYVFQHCKLPVTGMVHSPTSNPN